MRDEIPEPGKCHPVHHNIIPNPIAHISLYPMHYKTIVLNSRPLTDIEPDTFRTETHPRSELKPGKSEALVQCTWLSLDPAMRGYIRDTRSYLPPVKIGEVCHILVGEICCAMVADITAGDACCWPWCGCGGWTREQIQRG